MDAVLHHMCDLPVAEVAAEVGAPVGTVKARLSRGRAALLSLLGDGPAGARGVFAELDYGPAPKKIDPRGEMGYFQTDGVVLVGNRLSWLSLSAIDVEWHFSRDPEFTDLPMHPFFTAMPRARSAWREGDLTGRRD